MLLFHSILTFMKDPYQSENQVFNPTRLLVLLHCWVGKDWAGPFFPPSKFFWSFYWSASLSVYVTLSLYQHLWMTDSKERIKFSNQTFYLYCYIGGWGKTGPAHSFPPSKMFWSFYFQSFSLCYSFTVSEDLWMTHSKEIIKFSIQKVYWLSPSKVFQPLYFILVNWFYQIVGCGKTGPIFL